MLMLLQEMNGRVLGMICKLKFYLFKFTNDIFIYHWDRTPTF